MAMEGKEELTAREHEVYAFLMRRWTNAEISAALVIDEPTVETHVANVLHKFGVKDRRELWRDALG